MKVLLFSTAADNIGETYTLGKFASELQKEGNECRFIATSLGRNFLLSMGFDPDGIIVLPGINRSEDEKLNYSDFKRFVGSFDPEFGIVADWADYSSADGFSFNRSYSLDWLDGDIRLGTFDHFGYAPEGIKTCFYKNGQKIDKEYEKLSDRFSFIIKPCPHHDNKQARKGNIFFWGVERADEVSCGSFSGTYKNVVEILLPVSFWQDSLISNACKERNIAFDYYDEVLLPIITEVLSGFDRDFKLYVIARRYKAMSHAGGHNVETIFLPPQSHAGFGCYMDRCDILLTDNFISSNIGKSLGRNIIPMVLQNKYNDSTILKHAAGFSGFIRERLGSLVGHGLVPEFKSFPIGFNDLPEIEGQDNMFLSCFVRTELYDKEMLAGSFDSLLNDRDTAVAISNAKRKYVERNDKLLTSGEILDCLKHN